MRNFKRLATSLVALVLVLAFSSCEKQQPQSSKISVSFDIADLTNGLVKKGAMVNGDPTNTNIEGYPTCTELATDYVVVTIDGVSHTLEMTSLPNSQTEVVQLDADAPNEVTSLIVFSNGQELPIYIAPNSSSLEVTEGGLVGVPFTIGTEAWDKEVVHVDVVCWHEYTHKSYAWNWYQIDYHQLKTICFFGDVCSKFYDLFGATGYDFQADFTVSLTYENSNGEMITNTASTFDVNENNWVNENGPLCISYLDDLNKDENATYDLILHTPSGEITLLDDEPLTEGTWSEIGKADGFGGEDGIYLFNVGNCGIDEDGQFPSYIPLPKSAIMQIGGSLANGYNITITQDVNGDDLWALSGISNAYSWCLDKEVSISGNSPYSAKVFSSLDLAKLLADVDIDPTRRARFASLPWGAINYMINHLDELPDNPSLKEIQYAFWYITDQYQGASQQIKNKIDDWVTDYANWKPKVGDDAVIFLIPDQEGVAVQAFGIRIDP
jgi:hypothetical protein